MFGKRKKDTRTYKGFKYWSIEKLQSVLDHAYCQGVDGADYEPYKEEMQNVLWDKINKRVEKNIDNYNAACYNLTRGNYEQV